MPNEKSKAGRVSILEAVQTPLGFLTLMVLVVEIILGVLANKATGLDFTLLVVGMVGLLFALVLIIARVLQQEPHLLFGARTGEAPVPESKPSPAPQQDYTLLHDFLGREDLQAIDQLAQSHPHVLVRLSAAHTLWSCRPDLAKARLEAAREDPTEIVRDHARALLRRFYGPEEDGDRDLDSAEFLRTLLPSPTLKNLEELARTHSDDYVRLTCAHTIWSCRPEFAKSVLNDAQYDLAELVRDHARTLLRHFYTPLRIVLTAEDVDFLCELLPPATLKRLAEDARSHSVEHIRLACAHTLWSCRPDLAYAILEDAQDDWAEPVRDHARALLRRFY
jgi:hypothetical protein